MELTLLYLFSHVCFLSDCHGDIAIIIDNSGSICWSDSSRVNNTHGCDNWQFVLRFVKDVVFNVTTRTRPSNTRVAVIDYGMQYGIIGCENVTKDSLEVNG